MRRQLEFKLYDYRAKPPTRATEGSNGFDLIALDDYHIAAGETVLIPVGYALSLGGEDLAGLILPRSGLGHKHGIVLGNLVGLVDGDYQGEWCVSCWNRSAKAYHIESGAAIAQFIIVPTITDIEFVQVHDFTAETDRGDGGFGHTDKK